jgi:CheY-like chemotaxis protein
MRILLADDNPDSVETLGILLELDGHEVRTAFDGRQALEMAIADPPDFAILDIGMPVMDGYEAAARLRDAAPGVVLIALSAYCGAEYVQRGQRVGFKHHLAKPLQLPKLRALLVRASANP